MATLSAKKIQEALRRAKSVGQVEEPATIVGCEVVFQSLRPDQYEAIAEETAEKEDIAFLNAYRMEHLCRSLVEFNGTSLRGIDTVEVDETDPKTGVVTQVKLEVHAFVRDQILSTWSREALDVAFKKFNDVVAKAERVSAEGVTFVVPDETPDEKYRRLLGDLKEIEGTIPMDLAGRLLDEQGYMRKADANEIQKADDRLSRLAAEDEVRSAREKPPLAPDYREPVVEPAPVQVAPIERQPLTADSVLRPEMIPQAESLSPFRAATPEELMAARQPMNRGSVAPSAPVQASQEPVRAQQPPPPNATALSSRYAEIEALESNLDGPVEVVSQAVDPKKVAALLDQPPQGGINPRFRPPPR